jgi:hypothetical protein
VRHVSDRQTCFRQTDMFQTDRHVSDRQTDMFQTDRHVSDRQTCFRQTDRHVSDRQTDMFQTKVVEKITRHFIFNNLFFSLKIVPFIR